MAAEAAISSAVELLGNLLIEKVKSIRGVEGKVQSLKEELEWMQSFMRKANKKQAEDEGVREWIKKVREVAQDAEDTIEIFLINVENAKNRGLLKRGTGFAKRMHHLDKIGDEIESIRSRLDAIDKSRERYGIKDLDDVAEPAWRSQVELRRRLSPWEKDEHLVGIEDDVKKLLRESILNEEKKGRSVGVLQGMGGIGKSTLAREVYNHSSVVVSGRFDCRGWVVVSSEFTPQETIKQIIFQISRSEEEKQKLLKEIKELEESMNDKLYIQRELKGMIYKHLEGKSYFIVLDDVWEKEHLESLIAAFPNQQDKTSRLLVTTRNKKLSGTNYDHYLHKMTRLDSEKSWELLLKKAFNGSTNVECSEELESIGRQISKKCEGLPLAISVVGGILVETQSVSRWKEVLNHLHSYLGRAEYGVSTILELSYQNLSPPLKACFLCLSFFKEDSVIRAKTLVNIWVGQGLIQHQGNTTLEEIGRGYINELINRSMLQIDEDPTIDDRVKYCRLHDLVRDMCIRKAKEEIGLEIVTDQKKEDEQGSSSKPMYKPRHRVVYGINLEALSFDQNKHIRSLYLHRNLDAVQDYLRCIPSAYWKSFQLLKTLDLIEFKLYKFPKALRLLIGLKNLKIRRHSDLIYVRVNIPSWLDRLINLEVLDVEGSVEFPNVVLKMKKLRHLHVWEMRGRVMKMKDWENIESLNGMRLKDWLECSSSLMATSHLRELGIVIQEFTTEDEMKRLRESLGKMENLVEFHLKFDTRMSIKDIDFNGLLPNGVTKLKISEALHCPDASVFPSNLTHLTFFYSGYDPTEELGKLPKLQYLTLTKRTDSPPLKLLVLHDGFPCLEALCLLNMKYLRGIDIEEGGMPLLKRIQIIGCPDIDIQNLPKHIIISTPQ